MPKRVDEPLVGYQIAIRGSTLDGIRRAAEADDVSIRKWIRDALEIMLKVQGDEETRRQAQRRRREEAMRQEIAS
jgi:hypothetical protein